MTALLDTSGKGMLVKLFFALWLTGAHCNTAQTIEARDHINVKGCLRGHRRKHRSSLPARGFSDSKKLISPN
jgi:hypothetical protein